MEEKEIINAAMELAKKYRQLEELAIERKKIIDEFDRRKLVIKENIIRLSEMLKKGIEV